MQNHSNEGFTGEIHPAAELFPLMGDDDLAALAADIKANGLRQPIVLDGDGKLLDGRNRLAACEIAKVAPEFASVNGADPVAFVVSLNVKRRNLAGSQLAIAAAESCQISDSSARQAAKRFGINHDYVAKARSLVERDPDVAAAVKSGAKSLDDAYREFRQREAQLDALSRKADVLRQKRADLFERVEAGGLTLDEAYDLMTADEARERQQRETMVQNIAQALVVLARSEEVAAGLVDDLYDNDHQFGWKADDCATASAFLAALEKRLRTKEAE